MTLPAPHDSLPEPFAPPEEPALPAPASPAPSPAPAMTDPKEDGREHTLTGDVRLHPQFASRYLEYARDVLVYLPPGYDVEAVTRYPVLYLHDGQNVFDRATAFGEEWQVDETAQTMISAGEIAPLIIVAVYNTGEHRIDEYTPTHVPEKGGGQADDYGRMLVEELKPFIDANYNTFPSAESTALGGSSLGGLVTLHLGMRYPTVFGRLAVLSPSTWWDERVVVQEVAELNGKLRQRIWLDIGLREGDEAMVDARILRDALVAKGWVLDDDLIYEEVQDGEHNEQSWAARMGRVLQYLFPAG